MLRFIHPISFQKYDEYKKAAEVFGGKIVKPVHATKILGMSRIMVFQLEREGSIRAYRLTFKDNVWEGIPLHLKFWITRSDIYRWIPVEDMERYAKSHGGYIS
jgi:hypothetical protein